VENRGEEKKWNSTHTQADVRRRKTSRPRENRGRLTSVLHALVIARRGNRLLEARL